MEEVEDWMKNAAVELAEFDGLDPYAKTNSDYLIWETYIPGIKRKVIVWNAYSKRLQQTKSE